MDLAEIAEIGIIFCMAVRFPALFRGIVLLVALALAATGFGHRMASAEDFERAQFTKTFGDAFCVTDEDGSAAGESFCPVCQLIASVYLPDPVLGAASTSFAVTALDFASGDHLVPSAAGFDAPSRRGPPLI